MLGNKLRDSLKVSSHKTYLVIPRLELGLANTSSELAGRQHNIYVVVLSSP